MLGVGKSNDSLKLRYHHLHNLTKAAAEKARNSWWSAYAVEAEKHAWVEEQCGHGGSPIRDLQLLRRNASAIHVHLIMRDERKQTRYNEKPRCWADHFSDVANCESEISIATLDVLPVLEPPSAHDECVNELYDIITEREIAAVISQMQKGRAPGMNRILTKMLKLDGVKSICWLKTIVYGVWRTEKVPSDWTSSCSCPSTRSEVTLLMMTIMVLPS